MAELKQTGPIVLGSSAKFFRKGGLGSSTGGEETLQFEVALDPGEELTPGQLGRLVLAKRREMDERLLVAEYLRGALSADELTNKQLILKQRYLKALGEEETE